MVTCGRRTEGFFLARATAGLVPGLGLELLAHKSHDTQDGYMRHPRRSFPKAGLACCVTVAASCDCSDLRPRTMGRHPASEKRRRDGTNRAGRFPDGIKHCEGRYNPTSGTQGG